jgi:GrpB-like predicted nucleotidyltransferase (UPF0157 family)
MTIDVENVELVEYNPEWATLFQKEAQLIQNTIGRYVIAIEHIGSTAIPNLKAKPIIDILIGIESLKDSKEIISALETIDYQSFPENKLFPERIFFRKKISDTTQQQYNLHVTVHKNGYWDILLIFRDYLLAHPETTKEYELVKQHMATRFPNNRIAYGIGKEGYMISVIEKAKKNKH